MPPKKNKSVEKVEKVVKGEKKQVEKQEKPIEKLEKQQKKLVTVNQKGEITEPKASQLKVELGDGKFTNPLVRIACWNLNGIRASTKNESAVKYINEGKFDVLCFNELKSDESTYIKENLGTKFPKNYFHYLNFCKGKSGYSGVAMISKVKPISVKFDIGVEKHDQEGRAITLEFDKFQLVTCYVPNAGEKLVRLEYRTKEWDIAFTKYLNELRKKKPTILCGDLNVAHQEIDLANPKTNTKTPGFTAEERQGFTNLLATGWTDSFRKLHPTEQKYSFFSARSGGRAKNVGWRLDYFVINKENEEGIIESDINQEVVGSDHVPIECVVDTKKL